jgi:hypothetical protein
MKKKEPVKTVLLRLNPKLWEKYAKKAKEEHRSINSQIVCKLEEHQEPVDTVWIKGYDRA